MGSLRLLTQVISSTIFTSSHADSFALHRLRNFAYLFPPPWSTRSLSQGDLKYPEDLMLIPLTS
ncbi:MAG: hypothetical protein OWQ52_00620 [Metallosphaera prunae]|uniref:hypothetical protein n=1 Tax=Metallosphaera prunae TaxID=47304 RepID=UPI0022732E0E|nr:hypothetical protein [Metallosphaera prunae]MCY0860918.1 hypothetical protein [Metallosphaera prunae]